MRAALACAARADRGSERGAATGASAPASRGKDEAMHMLKAWVVAGLEHNVATKAKHKKLALELLDPDKHPILEELDSKEPPEDR